MINTKFNKIGQNNKFNLEEISFENTKIDDIINIVSKDNQPFIKMYFNIYKEHDIGKLHRLQNLFVLYNIIDKTIIYNGRKLYLFKQIKKSIENNFLIFSM